MLASQNRLRSFKNDPHHRAKSHFFEEQGG